MPGMHSFQLLEDFVMPRATAVAPVSRMTPGAPIALAFFLLLVFTSPTGYPAMQPEIQMTAANFSRLPIEDPFPSLRGATTWLNSPPLSPAGLRGQVVLVDFWTYTCINWLRTLPYLRAWSQKYRDQGLVVIGVHSPEFAFEKDLANVRLAVRDLHIEYPVAVDSEHAIWGTFENQYWPALYFIDAEGNIRRHQFGEGDYEEAERTIQQLLMEAGHPNVARDLVAVEPRGAEVSADWATLKSGENYLGDARTENFVSSGPVANRPHDYAVPSRMARNEWGLRGNWTINREFVTLNQAGGRIVYRFHARDLNLVMGPETRGAAIRFRVTIDGMPPGDARGTHVDELGHGIITGQGLYQLIRQRQPVADRTFEIEFIDMGVEAYAFTFG
jgi:thiol-disulfide isomerase/thioredoxin